MDIARFKQKPFMGILRGITAAQVPGVVDAVCSAGLESIEITMNTSDAPARIREMVAYANGRVTVGAGTVCSMTDLEAALSAGAAFVVSPVLVDEVVAACVERAVPIFPGALTPQEIYRAWQAGATMVKVFPARLFGPQYFKDINGPFPEIELLACSGVTPDTIADFFRCGASAIAFGSSVFRPDWLAAGDYGSLYDAVRELLVAGEAVFASSDDAEKA